ncbi:MAG TPA: hypothetical protein PLB92_00140 [Rhodoglobus sp.]|nr:hypothetical protein [Rhodoglobus sp.]
MHKRYRLVAALVAGLLVLGCTTVAASAAGEADPCAGIITDSSSTEQQTRWQACRLDRIESALSPVTETQTETATETATVTATQQVPTTVTAPPVTVTSTVTAAPTSTSATSTPATSTSATSTPPPSSGGWPDATNTGVPAGTTLTAYTGPLTITTAGTVIDRRKITGCVVIKANNVTIKNSLLQTNGCFFNVLSDNGNTGLVLQDVEIDGQGNSTGDSAVNGSGFTCLRCNIHGTVDGFKAGTNVVIQDSWIHDLVIQGDSHNDGIQSLGTTSLKIIHNRIVLADGATSAVILSTGSASAMKNVEIRGNLLGGGAFTVYGGYAAGQDVRSRVDNISITDNRFTTVVFPRSGAYGPLTSADPPVVLSGNLWLDGPKAGQSI